MTKKTSTLILALAVILQCACMFYWASHKEYYYVDELYTFEYVQNINDHRDSIEHMDDCPLWRVEEWIPVKDLKTRFTIEEGESVFDLPAALTVKKFFSDRNYMWIINALETAFGNGEPPKWICICFNVIVWIIFQFLLFCLLAGCLGLDRRTSLLAVAMWGFSPLVLGLSVFCRFYSWTLLLFLVVLILHRLMWDSDSHWKNLAFEVLAFIALWLAFKNSELILVLGGSFVFFFAAALFVRKRYNQAMYYSLPLIGGGLFLVWRNSSLLEVLLHPSRYTLWGNGAAARHAYYLMNTTFGDKAVSLLHSVKEFAESVPGSFELTLAAVLLGAALFLAVRKGLKRRFDGFALVLLGTAAVFWLFCGICGLIETRYYSFLFLLAVILIWMAFDRLALSYHTPSIAFKVALCLVLAGALSTFYKRNIQYIYEGLEPYIEKIEEHKGVKAVVNYDPVHNYNNYYSTFVLDGSSSIYPICRSASDVDSIDLPDEFLYWSILNHPSPETLKSIKKRGYSVDLLYKEGMELVYVCQKNE